MNPSYSSHGSGFQSHGFQLELQLEVCHGARASGEVVAIELKLTALALALEQFPGNEI